MKQINPAWVEAVARNINSSPYFRLQSMRIVDLGRGWSHLEIEVGDKHLQPFGVVHGGVFSSLVDAAGFWAVYTEADVDAGMTTVEMKLNYLAPAASGRIIGRGRCIKMGRTLGLADASLENEDGRLLAHGTVTLMTAPGMSIEGSASFPEKYTD